MLQLYNKLQMVKILQLKNMFQIEYEILLDMYIILLDLNNIYRISTYRKR